VIGWAISLEKYEEEDQCVYPRETRQGSEKACKLSRNSLIYLILEFDSQAPQFIGERAKHFAAKI